MQNFQQENIHLAIETINKNQHEISHNIQQRENILTKWKQMLIQEQFPADLKFKINGYKQYPKSISKKIIETANREEEEVILDFRKKFFAVRINVYEQDCETLKAKVCNNDADWHRELDTFIPDLTMEAKQYAMCYLNNLRLRKTIDEKSNPRPTPALTPTQQPIAMEVAEHTVQDQLNQMQKEVQRLTLALKKQTDGQQHDKHRRQKNESGSGSGSTRQPRRDNNAYHAASRSNSRPPSKSTTSNAQKNFQHRKGDNNNWPRRNKSQERGRSQQRSPHRGRSQSRGRSPYRKNNRSSSRDNNYKGKGKHGGGQRRSNSNKRN